ncbi:MAG: glutathione peroxidase [Chitinophagaceae bacterium]
MFLAFKNAVIKKWQLFLLLLVSTICLTTVINSDMTIRQSILKAFYPVIMWFSQLVGGKEAILTRPTDNAITPPTVSFYSLQAIANNGDTISFENLKGKKVMIVNTASDCGFTAQYAELEELYQQQKDSLVILAFPSNNFKNQEKKSDSSIATFCKINFGVTFPLMKKTDVKKTESQHPVYQWLSNKTQNGWCNQMPTWNFSKYLIDEKGNLTHFFRETVSPLSKEVKAALNNH